MLRDLGILILVVCDVLAFALVRPDLFSDGWALIVWRGGDDDE
jgi:hypothetical protein